MKLIESTDKISEFIVEEPYIQSLNGGIKKKFTSLATNATLFKWKFGDDPVIEITDNPHEYTFKKAGTYSVSHQSCAPCGLDLICSQWCTKSITVAKPKEAAISPILTLGLLSGFIYAIIKKKNCEKYKNIKDCQNTKECHWKGNKCIKKNKEEL